MMIIAQTRVISISILLFVGANQTLQSSTINRDALQALESPPISFECGKRGIRLTLTFNEPRILSRIIVGGEIAQKKSWPWMALLGRKRGPRNDFFCSASTINKNYVITAAHCLKDFEPFFVRLGEHDYDPRTPDFSTTEDFNVTDILPYPEYRLHQGYDDVALLKLAQPIHFREGIQPICLPWGDLATEDIVGQFVTITGWGTTEYDGEPSSVLREVNVTVFDPSICESSYSTLWDYPKTYPEGMNTGNVICAGDPRGGKASCQGDSGGPVIRYRENDQRFVLTGIISKGFGCGKKDFPGISSPIGTPKILRWIKSVAFQ